MSTLKSRLWIGVRFEPWRANTTPLDHIPGLSNRLKKALAAAGVITAAQLLAKQEAAQQGGAA
jgi:hypothetical protein